MKARFRIAAEADFSEILSMMEDFYSIDNYPFDTKISEKNVKQFVQNQDLGRLWIIEVSERTIGYIVLTFGFSFEYRGRDAFIDEFYIKEPYRHRGIGKKALAFVATKAKEFDIKAIHLEVEHHNKLANRLYSKNGYVGNDRALMTKRIE